MTDYQADNVPAAPPLPMPPLPLPSSQALPLPLPGYPLAAYPIAYWPSPPPPRVWTALLVPVLAIIGAVSAASIVIVIAALIRLGPQAMQNRDEIMAWAQSYGGTPEGFLVLVLPGQTVFLAAALLAAALSPVPLTRRLGLVRPRSPWWIVPLLVLATSFAGICGDLLTSVVFHGARPSEHLEQLYNLFRGPTGAFLVMVTVAVSLLPGLSEEMLFRGYAQGRLLERWHPIAAIGLTSAMFAAAHLDPTHMVGVLPLGIWLGVIAWLCRSIWPGVICHAVNNATAVLLVNFGVADIEDRFRFDATGTTMFCVTGTLTAVCVWVMWRYRKGDARIAPANQ